MMEEKDEVEVVNSWSAPRSLSTCLMYSFAQRDDTEVVDEPFYALMLQVSGGGIERPYREDLLTKMVSNDIIFGPRKKKYRYCKQSYDKVAPSSFLELGYSDLVGIYSELCDLGRPPPIVESSELQRDPEGVLRHLCEDLGILFQSAMLKWELGPNPADGIWGPMWYKSLHKTKGFVQPRKHRKVFPLALYDVLEQCLPFYNFLVRQKYRQISPLTRPLSSEPEPPMPANSKIFVWVGNEILPLDFAKVSAVDLIFQGSGMVWEDLQIHNQKVLNLDEHLDRLFESSVALSFNHIPTREETKEAIFTTLITNGMYHNAQVKVSLMPRKNVASGVRTGRAQDQYKSTLLVLPEWKPPINDSAKCVALVTAPTSCLSNTVKGNNVAATDVIILDEDGFVSETTGFFNLFLVKDSRVLIPHAERHVSGIAREMVISLVMAEGLPVEVHQIRLSELHNADEAWIIGTMDEVKAVIEVDGNLIGDGSAGFITQKIISGLENLMEESGVSIPTD